MATVAEAGFIPSQDVPASPHAGVIGLDLSLTSTGVALPDGETYRIRTRQADGDRRLLVIRDQIVCDLDVYRPELAVVEDLPRHAMGAGVTAMVHGVVRAALAERGIPYALVVPATLKAFACDHGRATKEQLAAAAYLAAGAEFADDRGGDQCDAWWLRAAGHEALGEPLFGLPEKQRERLRKVSWPVSVRGGGA